jgi:hypothetical protein
MFLSGEQSLDSDCAIFSQYAAHWQACQKSYISQCTGRLSFRTEYKHRSEHVFKKRKTKTKVLDSESSPILINKIFYFSKIN